MAIDVFAAGSAASSTASNVVPITVTLTRAVAVGDDLYLQLGWAGGTGIVPGVPPTDSKGNAWVEVARAQENTTPLTWTVVYRTKVTTALAVGDTVSYLHSAAAGNRDTVAALSHITGGVSGAPFFVSTNTGVGTAVSRNGIDLPADRVAGPRVLFFVGYSAPAAYTVGASGLEIYEVGNSGNSRRIALDEESTGPGSPDPYTATGTLATSQSWAAIAVVIEPSVAPIPPEAYAGDDRRVRVGSTALLDGSLTSHTRRNGNERFGPGPAGLTYAWTQTAGPTVGAITNATSRRATYTVPNVATGTVLTFRLTATSTVDGATHSDTVTHTVGPILPRVDVKLGDLAEQTFYLDPDADETLSVDDPLIYLDGVTLGWRYVDPDEVVRQIEPMVATVAVNTPDVAHVAALDEGQLAFVRVFDEYGDHVASVHGRTGDLKAGHERRERPDGSVQIRTTVTVDITDHVASQGWVIDELVTAKEKWGARWWTVNNWLWGDEGDPPITPEVDFPVGFTDPDPRVSAYGNARAVTIQNQAFVDLLLANLYEMPLTKTPTSSTDDALFVGHYMLLPIADATTGALDHLSLHVVPGIEAAAAATYFPTPNRTQPAAAHPHRIHASRVELGGQWSKLNNARPNKITVKLRNNADTADVVSRTKLALTNGRRITRQLDAQYACKLPTDQIPAVGDPIASMHLPEQDVEAGWDRDGFTYYPETFHDLVNEDYPASHFGRVMPYGPLGGSWFPDLRRRSEPAGAVKFSDGLPRWWSGDPRDHDASEGESARTFELAPDCFLRPVMIEGIHPDAGFSGGTYHGHLVGASLTITDARPVVSFELARTAPGTVNSTPTTDPEVTI